MILVHFYYTFAEAHAFEIRYSAFCFDAWNTALVEISQRREKMWEGIVFVEIFCVTGSRSAEFCSYFPHWWQLRKM